MKTSDFYYELPQELIAQDPLEDRSSSRLMKLDKKTGEIEHKIFRDIIEELNPGTVWWSIIQRSFRRDFWASRKTPVHISRCCF